MRDSTDRFRYIMGESNLGLAVEMEKTFKSQKSLEGAIGNLGETVRKTHQEVRWELDRSDFKIQQARNAQQKTQEFIDVLPPGDETERLTQELLGMQQKHQRPDMSWKRPRPPKEDFFDHTSNR